MVLKILSIQNLFEHPVESNFLKNILCFIVGVSCTALSLPDGQIWLFDCGEATQIQLQKSALKMGKITKIFITHLHGDHLFGLPGLLSTLGSGLENSKAVKKQVDVYGPHGLYKYITVSLELSRSKLAYKLNIFELMPEADQFGVDWAEWPVDHESHQPLCMLENSRQKLYKSLHPDNGKRFWLVYQDKMITVRAVPITHRIPCFGFVVEEADKVGALDVEKAKSLGVAPGPDYARLKNGETIIILGTGLEVKPSDVVGPSQKGRKLVILGDTSETSEIQHFSLDADVVVHEATMEDSLREKAIEFGHSTSSMAAEFAVKVKCRKLCLTHLSPRYKPLSDTTANDVESAKIIKNEAQYYLEENDAKGIKLIVAEDFIENVIEHRP